MPGTIFVDEDHDGNRITGLPTPTDGDEAATKDYVDSGGGGNVGTTIISGGGVAWTGTGFNYIISACVYLINGVQYSSAQTPVTLTAAHATLDRIDVFYADVDGLAGYITGTPAANPVAPSVDPATQIYLSFAYVVAATSTPSLTNEPLYLENTEWTYSDNSANLNPDSISNPYAGTKDIEATTAANGNLLTLVKPSGTLLPTDYGSLLLQIRSKATWPNAKALSIFWLNGTTVIGTAVTLKHGTFAFDSSNTASYQQIVIPASTFNTGTQAVDRLRITVTGGGAAIGWYLDNIILQTGIGGGGGGGDFSTNTNVSVAGEVVVFANTVGKLGRRSTGTGLAKLTSGVLGTAVAGTDYLAPSAIDDTAYDATTWNGDTTHAPTKNAVRDKIESMGAGASVDDTAFASSWNGVTTTAPSKNAVYDELHKIDSADDGTIVNAGTGFRIAGAATTGKVLIGNGTNFIASTPTYPAAAGTSGNVLTSDGTNWTSAPPTGGGLPSTTVQVSGSDFTTSSTTAVNITGLTFAAAANKTYEVEVTLVSQSTTAAGFVFGIAYSGTLNGTTDWVCLGQTTSGNSTTDGAAIGSLTASAFATINNQPSITKIWAAMITTSSGNITVQIAKVTSGSAIARIGSRMTVTTLA